MNIIGIDLEVKDLVVTSSSKICSRCGEKTTLTQDLNIRKWKFDWR